MASEDSDEIVSGFLPVHRLDDLCGLDETFGRLVAACRDELEAARELLKVLLPWAPHWIAPEEWNDRLQKIPAATYGVPIHVLPVVVIPPVWDHSTDAEILTEIFEARYAGGALRDRELVRDLETGPVALSAGAAWLPHETD